MPSSPIPPLQNLTKPFNLPPSFAPPTLLTSKTLTAVPLSRVHLAEDLLAVNSSLSLIRRTRGGSWPSAPLTEEYNYLDLCWHEREFRDHNSFAYAVYEKATNTESNKNVKEDAAGGEKGNYIGCFYLYSMGTRTMLSEENVRYDVDVSWWVTEEGYGRGVYEELFQAVEKWMKEGFDCFEKIWYSNVEVPGREGGESDGKK